MIFVLFLAKPTVKPVHPKIHVKAVQKENLYLNNNVFPVKITVKLALHFKTAKNA